MELNENTISDITEILKNPEVDWIKNYPNFPFVRITKEDMKEAERLCKKYIKTEINRCDCLRHLHTELHWVTFYHYVRYFCTKGKRNYKRREMIDADIKSSLGIDKFGEIKEILEKLNSIWWCIGEIEAFKQRIRFESLDLQKQILERSVKGGAN